MESRVGISMFSVLMEDTYLIKEAGIGAWFAAFDVMLSVKVSCE